MTTETVVRKRAGQLAAVVAIVFGLISIGAGGSVLAGRDPGYMVFRPLLVFNTVMGFLYVGSGALVWRRARAQVLAAAAIFGANLMVLAYVVMLYRTGGGAAIDSVRAMMLRSGMWLVILLVVRWTASAPRDGN